METLAIRDVLTSNSDFKENPIDNLLFPVLPFRISNDINLIILGQDPTVKNEKSRRSIEYTLNLDKSGSLKSYISEIAETLRLKFDNVYATNFFKYFYSDPPERTMHVLYAHLEPNLRLLMEELSAYPKVPIITLGLPVLRLLTHEKAEVHRYWGYDKKSRRSTGVFDCCKEGDNKLERNVFPFPHQPSLRKPFYKETLMNYLKYVRRVITRG